jgi:hypothetical protein
MNLEAIEAYRKAHGVHGDIKPADLRFLAKSAFQGRKNPYYGSSSGSSFSKIKYLAAPYKPEGGARLKLSKAMDIGWSHEAYADHGYYAIPYEGELDKNSRSRLSAFLSPSGSSNGFAGFGSSYNVHKVDEANKIVFVYVRSSIAD